jgi:ubiquinone/menaquinone biosynthesis C-methylase UbiE
MKQWNEAFKKKGKIFLEPQENMAEVVKLFKKKEVKKILDLGCGTGRHLIYLAKNKFDVYGIDIAEEGISQSRKWLKSEGQKANLKIGSMYEKLPYKDNYFDAIVSIQALHHERIINVRKAIKEVERILKPGGLVFMSFFKRKLKKAYSPTTIVKKFGKQQADYKIIEPRTYMSVGGIEKGLPHYMFNKKEIRKEFHNFKIYDIWVDSRGYSKHYCFLGELKK